MPIDMGEANSHDAFKVIASVKNLSFGILAQDADCANEQRSKGELEPLAQLFALTGLGAQMGRPVTLADKCITALALVEMRK